MPTNIPNVNTTRTAVLNQILAEIISAVTGASSANTFIAAAGIWLDAPPGDFYIELVPGAGQDKAAKHPYGWIVDGFTVCIFKRLYIDQAERDTARIASATQGLLSIIAQVEGISESYVRGLALVPILPERYDAPEVNPNDPDDGWVMMRRSFKVEWLYSLPGPHSVS